MQIFVMRHGEAANSAVDDSSRPLTKQGLLESKLMGQWLLEKNTQLLAVFVSPYIRAQQTSAGVSNLLIKSNLITNQLTTLDLITPSGSVQQVHDFLDGFISQLQQTDCSNKDAAILFVSHMPFVSYFVAELTEAHQMPIFSTGAIAIIDYDITQMKGCLLDIISPDVVEN